MTAAGPVWLLCGDKAGDNAQLAVLREYLDDPVEYRRLTFLPRYVHGKPRFRATLAHLDAQRSDPLAPPWPRLVITIGRRPTMAALWIKARSAGRTHVAVLGRPHRWLERFDLVVVPAQYAVPAAPNVVNLTLPLMRVAPERLKAAAAAWRSRLAPLPRPLIAVLAGGTTSPYRFDAEAATDLLRVATGYAGTTGTVYVTTSRRTPAAATTALAANLPDGGRLYRWGDPMTENPYPALLAHADGFVVTGDSISMLTEVARQARPLAIYPLPEAPGLRKRAARAAARLMTATPPAAQPALERLGLRLFPRDLERVHRWMFRRGLAVAAGDPLPEPGCSVGLDDELGAVLQRIAELRRRGRCRPGAAP